MYNKILFCDFDGTITAEETLEGTIKRFVTNKPLYYRKMIAFLVHKITLAQAVHMAFQTIPASKLPEIEEYVRGIQIRPGFENMLKTAKELGIPVVILSGGMKPTVEEKVAPYRDLILDVWSCDLVTTDKDTLDLVSDFEEGDHIISKERVMEQYDYETAYCIGDSYTDFHMAEKSELVFARDRLLKKMEKEGKPCIAWETFDDIAEELKKLS